GFARKSSPPTWIPPGGWGRVFETPVCPSPTPRPGSRRLDPSPPEAGKRSRGLRTAPQFQPILAVRLAARAGGTRRHGRVRDPAVRGTGRAGSAGPLAANRVLIRPRTLAAPWGA